MDKKEQILHYHRIDGLSQREIARRVGVCRKTVKRYITEYEAQVQSDPEDGANMCLASKPKYPSRKVECTRMTDAVRTEIDYWLEENAKRRLTGMRKQCLKRQDIHLALMEKGFSISCRTPSESVTVPSLCCWGSTRVIHVLLATTSASSVLAESRECSYDNNLN